jgi:1,4-dihydroxy-2-naphthoate octaprenyltransferase
VLVCGLLSKKELLIGVAVTMVLNAGVGCVLTFFYERSWILPLIFVSWALLWIYSYAPFKLSYRGGGEVVQALGVGFLLLFFGYYAQAGNASHFPWHYLVFVLPLQLGAAFSTALPDEPSDREGRKHTLVVLVGPVPVKLLVVFLYFTGLGFFCFIGWPGPGSLKTYLLVAYPLLAAAVMALLIKDGPAGHWRCTAFVALAVSSVVATMATLAGDLLLCRSEGQRLFG